MNPINEISVIYVNEEHIAGEFLDGEIVIMNKNDNVYYGLNEVGGRVWQLIGEPQKVADLIDIMMEEYDVDQSKCTSEVLALLNDMAEKGLIAQE